MHPNFHAILYDFFIKGHGLDFIAATYETSWYEVAEVLDSPTAQKHMRAAIRVQRLRAVAQNVSSRLFAIRALESTIERLRDSSHSSIESRRRAASAILSGTASPGRSSESPRAASRPKPEPPASPPPAPTPPPEKQTAQTSREPTQESAQSTRQSTPKSGHATRAPARSKQLSQPVRSRQPARSLRCRENSS